MVQGASASQFFAAYGRITVDLVYISLYKY